MTNKPYLTELREKLQNKQNELNKLYEDRKALATCKESFWNLQHAINSLQVDIHTIKSRIENYGKDAFLSDIEKVIINP